MAQLSNSNKSSVMPTPPEGAQADWKYEGVRYNQTELPALLPPTLDLLPWERKEVKTLEKQEIQQQKTIEAYDKAQHRKQEGGLKNNLAAFFGPHVAKLKNRPGRVREDIPTDREEKRFNDRFHFQTREKLLFASKNCKLFTNRNFQIIGKLYISERYVAFRESHLQPRPGQRMPVLFSIPLTEIVMLSKGMTLKEYQPGEIPEFKALDTHMDGADTIFVYTSAGVLHRFSTFWTQQSYADTYNVLDRQWRVLTGRPIGQVAPTIPLEAKAPSVDSNMRTTPFDNNVRTTVVQPTLIVEQTSTIETMKN